MAGTYDPRITPPKGRKERLQICAPITGLRAKGYASAALDHQLVYGQMFDVYQTKGRYAWGQEVCASGQGYVGYVALSALTKKTVTATHRICARQAPVFAKADLKSFIRLFLPLNAPVKVDPLSTDYGLIKGLGYVHKNHMGALIPQGGDFVSIAERFIGLPYVWGGIGPNGVDCSGLVQTALRACGQDSLRDADMQMHTLGHPLDDQKTLKRGDLIFWRGHVGIMRDHEMLLHANAYHMLVVSEPLEEAKARIQNAAGPIIAMKRL